jgi:sulfite exporter TauE/SafE
MTGWLSVLVASLVGSLHCVGMCGGLVGFYATDERRRSARWAPHLTYHLTRLLGYTALGAAAGQLGSGLDAVGASLGIGRLGLLLALLTLVWRGLPALLGRGARERLARLGRQPTRGGMLQRLERTFAALAQRASARPPLWRASALGLSSALLPCGWLYAFVLLAAGAGSARGGALLLLAFWSGTVPALLGLGLGLQRLGPPLRARLPRLSAALVLAACVANVASRWPTASAANLGGASPPTPSCHHAH